MIPLSSNLEFPQAPAVLRMRQENLCKRFTAGSGGAVTSVVMSGFSAIPPSGYHVIPCGPRTVWPSKTGRGALCEGRVSGGGHRGRGAATPRSGVAMAEQKLDGDTANDID